ncbi:MAG: type III pantothenate kinase [Ferruginibacter sp.]
MTTLCLDFGNSRFKAAIFNANECTADIILPDDTDATIAELLQTYQPQRSILSSVTNHNISIEHLLLEHTQFHKVSANTNLPFTIASSKKETIGADRLALVAAAVHFYPLTNNLIIALGSCITYNFVNQYNHFLGGSISPGLNMRFKAMHQFTAKLPLIENYSTEIGIPLVGYDTATNMQSGVVTGICCELEGIIEKYKERYGNFNVVLTGGNSAYFASQLKNKIFADSIFLFKGLYALSELNNCGD